MRIVIAGGGSAGWMSAAYLSVMLSFRFKSALQITVVESKNIGRIGVGEATVPTIRKFLATIGVSERAFMKAAQATFKHGIRFENWLREGHRYYHPFDRLAFDLRPDVGADWLERRASAPDTPPFAYEASLQPALCDQEKAPKRIGAPDYAGRVGYAYHMDAERFGDFLADFSVKRGVEHVVGDINRVCLAENGFIEALELKDGRRIAGDLFLDCTGAAAVLVGDALEVPYTTFSKYLLCDRAVAMQIPRAATPDRSFLPCTISNAQQAGWIWDIGLQSRRGTGYVYSSAYIDDDAAEARLRAYNADARELLTARRLRFSVGRRARAWEKNCVAIGLSGGFIEPLESTGIYLIEFALRALVGFFPAEGSTPAAAGQFNKLVGERYDEIVDFINLHYCLTQRTDSEFWRAVQHRDHITPSLANMLELWREKLPSPFDFANVLQLFGSVNYEFIMFGMEWRPTRRNGIPTLLDSARLREQRRRLQPVWKKQISELPGHQEWLRTLSVADGGDVERPAVPA